MDLHERGSVSGRESPYHHDSNESDTDAVKPDTETGKNRGLRGGEADLGLLCPPQTLSSWYPSLCTEAEARGAWRTIAGYEAIHMIRKGQPYGSAPAARGGLLHCFILGLFSAVTV